MRKTTYYKINVNSPKYGKYSINADTPNERNIIFHASKHKLFKDAEDKYYVTHIQKAYIKNIFNNSFTTILFFGIINILFIILIIKLSIKQSKTIKLHTK